MVQQAFQAAWASACKVGGSTMMVPSKYTFLVGPISFSGPYCQPNIVFQVIPKSLEIVIRNSRSRNRGKVHTLDLPSRDGCI